jgi:hypothetical protein
VSARRFALLLGVIAAVAFGGRAAYVVTVTRHEIASFDEE